MTDTKQPNEPSQEPESEVLDFTKPDFVFTPKGEHEWKQHGPYLVCKSCEIEHATWVGMQKLMVGIDKKGLPIMKTRKELNM